MLDLGELQKINEERANRWHTDGMSGWTALEWAGAMCGEAGEAANAAKKLKRIDSQLLNNDGRLFGQIVSLSEQREIYKKLIAKEVGDTILYGVLLCTRLGMSVEDAVREVFNQKSEEYNFPERI